MAEDLPQDSSGSQETAQDSGITANEKVNNPMEKIAKLEGDHFKEKYDLTVMVQHGIGNQNLGDTFELIYKALEDDFTIFYTEEDGTTSKIIPEVVKEYFEDDGGNEITDGSIQGNAEQKVKNRVGVDIEIPLDKNECRTIALRESYWHSIKYDTKNFYGEAECDLGNLNDGTHKPQKSTPLHVLFIGLIQIILLKLLQFRLSTISFILIAGSILNLAGSENNYDVFKMVSEENKEKFNQIISSPISYLIIAILIILVIYMGLPLYRQIKNCSLGPLSSEVEKASKDIKENLSKSRELMVVAHSMGGYISYEALSSGDLLDDLNVDGTKKKVSLVGLGSGLGPMTIIQKVKKENIICNLFLIIFLLVLLFLYVFVWSALYLNFLVWASGANDGSRVLWWVSDGSLGGTSNLFGIDLRVIHPVCSIISCIEFLVIMRFFIEKVVYAYYSKNDDKYQNSTRFSHREFYYSSDIVGNTSRFVYPKSVGQELLGNPATGTKKSFFLTNIFRRFVYSHDLGYYLQNVRLLQFLEWGMSGGIKSKYYYSKDYKPAALQAVYCSCFFVALVDHYIIYAFIFGREPKISLLATVLFVPMILGSCWIIYFVIYFISSVVLYIRRDKGEEYLEGGLMNRTLLDKDVLWKYALIQFSAIAFNAAVVSLYSVDIMKFLINFILSIISVNLLWAIIIGLVILCIARNKKNIA